MVNELEYVGEPMHVAHADCVFVDGLAACKIENMNDLLRSYFMIHAVGTGGREGILLLPCKCLMALSAKPKPGILKLHHKALWHLLAL